MTLTERASTRRERSRGVPLAAADAEAPLTARRRRPDLPPDVRPGASVTALLLVVAIVAARSLYGG